jgi:hypothetical protein
MQFKQKCKKLLLYSLLLLSYIHGRTADDVTITWMKNRSFFWNYKINIPQFEETVTSMTHLKKTFIQLD